jgi:PEP-CTERM motif-containing protein
LKFEDTSEVQLNLTGTSGAKVSAFADSINDFSHTLSFAASGPVFNLPTGYTVNSVDGGIVDNHFVTSTVPEPGTLILLGAGLLGMAGAFRRKLRV